jgi:uncharacterized protein YjiS (DUF1127 family)
VQCQQQEEFSMILSSLMDARRIPLIPQFASCVGAIGEFIWKIRRLPSLARVWFMRVESRRQMAMLSDHILYDIGLTRADIERGVMKPFWRE